MTGTDQSGRNHSSRQAVLEVFAHYRTYHSRALRNPQEGSGEWVKVGARLKEGYTVDELKRAIDGNHCSPWHCGENPGNRTYHKLTLIMRSGSHVDEFIELAEQKGAPVLSEQTVRGLRGAEAWLEHHEVRDETD